ncbi:hypothetical protein I4U23_009606 [Adineta vaga]|nr:hypothetical protein I4U23_009606 [Adineta vaga]
MDGGVNQQQLLLNSTTYMHDTTITEETPLTDFQENECEGIQSAIPEALDWNTSLISQICRDGDLPRLRDFIEYSQQTSFCGRHAAEIADRLDIDTGLSPLHHAARCQQLNICLILLSNIAFEIGVNIKDENGRTPLHSAFRLSNTSTNTNESNLEKQFNPETDFGDKIQTIETWQDNYKNKICSSAHPLIYLFALANGNINACDKYLLTPLHYAVARNNLAGVKQLIELNANIEAQDRQNIRPLHLACKEGYLSIVEYLILKGSKIEAKDDDQWTPLHYACEKGHLDIIKLYKLKLKNNFQGFLQMKTNTNASCLHLAVQHGNINTVEYILTEFKGDTLRIFINEQVESFGTPFHIAAKFCDPFMLRLLYRHGADPLILNSHNQSALHIACESNRPSIVQELYSLTGQSLLEIKDNHSHTALSVTTHLDIVKQLITYGADISTLDNNHMNVIMIAVSKIQFAIVQYLLSVLNNKLHSIFHQITKKNHRSIFLLAVQSGSIEMCSLLLTNLAIRWDTIDKQRMNVFHIAAQNNHYELIEFLSKQLQNSDKYLTLKSRSYSIPETMVDPELTTLIRSSSNLRTYIDAQNEDGKTPLHLAAEQGYASSVDILLKYGADPLFPNYLGQLPLHASIQNGHSQCVSLLMNISVKNMSDFQFALSRRQSPLITACQNGFTNIVRLLLEQDIGLIYDDMKEKQNPLEIAIEYRQIETIHTLLDHPSMEQWLMSMKNTNNQIHQTPLRDLIRYIPECATHAFDKFILKTNEIDADGNIHERTTFVYKHIDDYFLNENELYATNSHLLYRNHPFIIALDTERHSLLEHPLSQLLIKRKWKLYRPFFYLTRILSILLLLVSTFYVLIVSAPYTKHAEKLSLPLSKSSILHLQWTIVVLGGMNLFKILSEIILYRGFRVPFAQLFAIISFLISITAFIPYENRSQIVHWQWQLAAFATLFQWFNTAFILRSVPFVGNFIVMFQSILLNFVSLVFAILPLLVAFTIGTQMIFHNHPSFLTVLISMHKISAMTIGEFDYETLFYSKPILQVAATLLFTPFLIIMSIILMNLLLGLTVGDIQSCMKNARAKAHAYRIRELIYIESTLPSIAWLKSNIIDSEFCDTNGRNTISKSNDEQCEIYNESLLKHGNLTELSKLADTLNMLCVQAKQILEKEIDYEKLLQKLLTVRQTQSSIESTTDESYTSR